MLRRRLMPPENCLTGSRARSASPVRSSAQSTCFASSAPESPCSRPNDVEVLARGQQRIDRELLRHDAELRRRASAQPPADRTRESRRRRAARGRRSRESASSCPRRSDRAAPAARPGAARSEAPSSACTAPNALRARWRRSGCSSRITLRAASAERWSAFRRTAAAGRRAAAVSSRAPSPESRAPSQLRSGL